LVAVQGVQGPKPALEVLRELGRGELHGREFKGRPIGGFRVSPLTPPYEYAMRSRFRGGSERRSPNSTGHAVPNPSSRCFSTATLRKISTARSIKSWVIVKGGANRITVSCVSLDCTPAAARRSTMSCA